MKSTGMIVIGLLVSAGVSAFGQDVLTLSDCLSLAGQNNPLMEAARASVEKAGFDRRGAYSEYLPQLSASAQSGTRKSDEVDSTESDSFGVSARQTLYAGGKNRAAVRQSTAALDAAEARRAGVGAQVTYEVRQAFAELLFAQEQIRLAREIEKRQRDNLAMIELRYEGGRENKGALLRMQAVVRDAQFGTSQAGRNLRVFQRQLLKAIGSESKIVVLARGDLKPAAPGRGRDFSELVEYTPEYRQAWAEVQSVQAALASAKSQNYPELSANASATRAGESWMPERDEWFVGLSVSYPFFPGGRNLMDVKSARADLRRSEESLAATAAETGLFLEKAFAAYEESFEQTEVETGYLEAARVRAEIARTQYDSGLTTFEEWDRIENELITRQKSELSVRKAAVVAEAAWEKARGRNLLAESGLDEAEKK